LGNELTRNFVLSNSSISNTYIGINIVTKTDYILLNNTKIFNNYYGIENDDDRERTVNYLTINNSLIHNNSSAIELYRNNRLTINNSHIFNNSNNGIYLR